MSKQITRAKLSRQISKSILGYLSKLKIGTPKLLVSSKHWIRSNSCKHTKTLSFSLERTHPSNINNTSANDAATLADIDRFLIENFGSLYSDELVKNDNKDESEDENQNENQDQNQSRKQNKSEDEEGQFYPPRASNRFFISPGTSSSIIEEARSSSGSMFDEVGSSSTTNSLNPNGTSISKIGTNINVGNLIQPEDSIAVLRNSPNPYEDFRCSMLEMIEARISENQSVHWDFMVEMFFCYLSLNDEKSYTYILRAFVDLSHTLFNDTDESKVKSSEFPIGEEKKEKKKMLTRMRSLRLRLW